MQNGPTSNPMTKAIVLGALTITALSVIYTSGSTHGSAAARAAHYHTKLIYVGHAPKTANG